MLVGVIVLGMVFGTIVAGTSLLLGYSILTAFWLYASSGIFFTLVFSVARYVCGAFKSLRTGNHSYSS